MADPVRGAWSNRASTWPLLLPLLATALLGGCASSRPPATPPRDVQPEAPEAPAGLTSTTPGLVAPPAGTEPATVQPPPPSPAEPSPPSAAQPAPTAPVQPEAPAEPRLFEYRALQAALARYQGLARLPWPGPLPALSGTAGAAAGAPRRIDPGTRWSGLGVLARRLLLLGDLTGDPDAACAGGRYAEPLVAAVRRFQERHGLDPDGVIGKATIAALEVPPAHRAGQIELSLARLRELPDPDEAPFILVNIPAFRLYAWENAATSERTALEMNIVVGQADSLQTPIFAHDLRYVIFRPFWHPPRSIIVNEILPALEQDPGYLDAHDMELCPSANDDVPALPMTPENMDRLRAGTARVRQRPGPSNTLGLAKFMFPNTHKVYLHDTASHGAFGRIRRDASHGCIRVQDPAALAEFVLRGENGWDAARIHDAMNGERTIHVDLTRRLPVWIVYLTAFADPDGTIRFYDDIYSLDASPTASPTAAPAPADTLPSTLAGSPGR